MSTDTLNDTLHNDCLKFLNEEAPSTIKTDNKIDLKSSDDKSLSDHNEQYTRLLEAYIDDYTENSKTKREKKIEVYQFAMWVFFSIPIMALIFASICLGLTYAGIDTSSILPEVIGFFGTVLSYVFIVFKIITNYLFNKNEEKNLTEIISKIQDYDKAIRLDNYDSDKNEEKNHEA